MLPLDELHVVAKQKYEQILYEQNKQYRTDAGCEALDQAVAKGRIINS